MHHVYGWQLVCGLRRGACALYLQRRVLLSRGRSLELRGHCGLMHGVRRWQFVRRVSGRAD